MESPKRPSDRPIAGTPVPNRVVVFADMLGFAALTEANPIDLRMLQTRSRVFTLTLDDFEVGASNALTKAFSGFHESLKWAITMAEMKHLLTAITFSDSVFVATNYLFEAGSFAVNLAQSMISQGIPVRMGIAFGSFAALRFRSDVSADSGAHAAQFLGTAIVRAYRAEQSCGIKGMRIFLHPSAKELLADGTHNPTSPPFGTAPIRSLECSNAECMNKANEVGVCDELDYWDLAPTKERSAWRGFQQMWAVAPETVRIQAHYQATAEAINRMRVAQGQAPLANLRRRTLPRCQK